MQQVFVCVCIFTFAYIGVHLSVYVSVYIYTYVYYFALDYHFYDNIIVPYRYRDLASPLVGGWWGHVFTYNKIF